MIVRGVLFLWVETGINGGWAIQDERHIHPPTEEWPTESWSYEGLIVLMTGDRLKAFNEDGSVFWEGTVELDARGKVQYIQTQVSQEQWGKMFIGEMKGELTRG